MIFVSHNFFSLSADKLAVVLKEDSWSINKLNLILGYTLHTYHCMPEQSKYRLCRVYSELSAFLVSVMYLHSHSQATSFELKTLSGHRYSGDRWFLVVHHDLNFLYVQSVFLAMLPRHSPPISFSNSSTVVSNRKWSSMFSFLTSISGLLISQEFIWLLVHSCWVVFMASQPSIYFHFKDLLHCASTLPASKQGLASSKQLSSTIATHIPTRYS